MITDTERLAFVLDERITISQMNGMNTPMVYRCQFEDCAQVDWYSSRIEAIDAAIIAQRKWDAANE